MSKWIKIAALTIAAVAVIILAYAVLTPEPESEDTDRMGMWSDRPAYSPVSVSLIIISAMIIAIALMIVFLWKEYEPLPPSMAPPPAGPDEEPELEKKDLAGDSVKPSTPPVPAPDEAAERDYLVLRLLTGDERHMFKAIMDSGGEALQKDLILRTKMSNAKVSRLLDKLVQKGVVTKERHGATNKVRIKRD